ncbi:MAG: alpha/beta hydrolase [Pseudomonadales bacterium]|nr:alpha/beta hydrolase [Pseudomonadales bacterium]
MSASANPDLELSYEEHNEQKLDLYLPSNHKNSPIIFMVHGGAWRFGDKGARAVVENKVNRWVSKGFIFISANYRLVPDADPLNQVFDIAMALKFVQERARGWGGDPEKIILMGHSAGAHLVSVLATSGSISKQYRLQPWLGTVSIDTAAFDIVAIMEKEHFRFYDKAFGNDKEYWKSVSPYHLLEKTDQRLLVICSTSRKDNPCVSAERFIEKSQQFGMRAKILKIDMSHKDANQQLGKDSVYTEQVEQFMKTLDSSVADRLTKP